MEIVINFEKLPRKGRTTTLIRCHFDDKKDFDKAADIIGITTAAFMRATLISASRAVIADQSLFKKDRTNGKAKNKG